MINLSNELKLLEEFEGFMPHPYLCPANKLTIGFGEIILSNKTYGKFSGDFIINSEIPEFVNYSSSSCLREYSLYFLIFVNT